MAEKLPIQVSLANIPYYSQWESPELAGKILTGELSPRADPLWRRSGAVSPREYEYWSKKICGMACLKSILKYVRGLDVPSITLAKKCATYGGYQTSGISIHKGLRYKPFTVFIGREYGLTSRFSTNLSVRNIVTEIAKENFVIASVSSSIRDHRSTPRRKGGHLVLITGYNLQKGKESLTYHDPSGFYLRSQRNVSISLSDFNKFFARRGIIIENPSKRTLRRT